LNVTTVTISRRRAQVTDYVHHDLFRRIEGKGGGVANIELDDLVAFVLHLLGMLQHRAANVVTDVDHLE
jgi:hypothetical protein